MDGPIGSRRVLGQRKQRHKLRLRYPPFAIILLLFLLFSSGYSIEKQGSTGPADPMIREFVRLVNAKRLGAGCPELKWDDRVAAIAQAHSRDMVSRHFFSHTNPDGKDPFERLKESNLTFSAAAENIALGQRTGKEVYDTWLRSPAHRKNMLDCRFTRHGVGRTGDRWTHVLFKLSKGGNKIDKGEIDENESGIVD